MSVRFASGEKIKEQVVRLNLKTVWCETERKWLQVSDMKANRGTT